ncbi:hypothetical protein KCU83_g532, partial [Aureobasidium melanogenum]
MPECISLSTLYLILYKHGLSTFVSSSTLTSLVSSSTNFLNLGFHVPFSPFLSSPASCIFLPTTGAAALMNSILTNILLLKSTDFSSLSTKPLRRKTSTKPETSVSSFFMTTSSTCSRRAASSSSAVSFARVASAAFAFAAALRRLPTLCSTTF